MLLVAKVVLGLLAVVLAAVLVWGALATARGRRPWGEHTSPDADTPWSVLGSEAARNWARLFDADDDAPPRGAETVRHGLREETKGRRILEQLLQRPFVKIRPRWLTNPETNRALELDCYNEELRLGVEFSGPQHSMFTPFYHGTPEGFARQQRRDRVKAELCRKQGVALLVVPYWEYGDRLRPFLVRELRRMGFLPPEATGDALLDALAG